MKDFVEISNLNIDNNIIKFSLNMSINFTIIDLIIYNGNQKLSINNFSLESSNSNYTIIINPDIELFNKVYFYINTPTHFSGIIYIYYNLKTLEFENSVSYTSLTVPPELESYNYDLILTNYNNIPINSTIENFIVCNGISSNSSIKLITSTSEANEFEVKLFDSLNNPVPDGDYILEIFTGG
ncbi:MAG: hypothetical protein ACRCTZ_07215 [Sarcina sp.]